MSDGPTFYQGDARPSVPAPKPEPPAKPVSPVTIPPGNPLQVSAAETFDRKADEAMPADAAAMKARANLLHALWGFEFTGWLLGLLSFLMSLGAAAHSPTGYYNATWIEAAARLTDANTDAVIAVVVACFWWFIAFGARAGRLYVLWQDAKLSSDKAYTYKARDPLVTALLVVGALAIVLFLVFISILKRS